jgi:exodeoxyribonuclease-1
MLFRYRARNYYDTLNDDERLDWQEFRQRRLNDPDMPMNLPRFKESIEQYEQSGELTAEQKSVIGELKQYVSKINTS